MNDYFYELAKKSAEIANHVGNGDDNIKAEWVYSQWSHETADFTSELMESNHNLGGLCQEEPNDTPQPDGNQYYINFPSYEAYASYFGHYLRYYREDGIYEAQSLEDYVAALHHGEYFGDTLENYLAGCQRVYNEEFGG
jgi:hypothetical protein